MELRQCQDRQMVDQRGSPYVLVPPETACMIRKVYRILSTGKNVEIRKDTTGKLKVFKVSREIEN